MLIRNINEVTRQPVEMDGVQGASMAIMVGREHGAPNFAMRTFRVEPGGFTPRHSHDFEHEVFITGGSGTVFLEGSDHPLRPGDVVYVPAESLHQFRAASDKPLEFLCLVPSHRNCGDPTPGS